MELHLQAVTSGKPTGEFAPHCKPRYRAVESWTRSMTVHTTDCTPISVCKCRPEIMSNARFGTTWSCWLLRCHLTRTIPMGKSPSWVTISPKDLRGEPKPTPVTIIRKKFQIIWIIEVFFPSRFSCLLGSFQWWEWVCWQIKIKDHVHALHLSQLNCQN